MEKSCAILNETVFVCCRCMFLGGAKEDSETTCDLLCSLLFLLERFEPCGKFGCEIRVREIHGRAKTCHCSEETIDSEGKAFKPFQPVHGSDLHSEAFQAKHFGAGHTCHLENVIFVPGESGCHRFAIQHGTCTVPLFL